jgi:hypothetical protein
MRAFAEARRHLAAQFLESDLFVDVVVDQARRAALPRLES